MRNMDDDKTIFIDPNGGSDEAGNGNRARPYKSIGYASAAAIFRGARSIEIINASKEDVKKIENELIKASKSKKLHTAKG